MRGAYDLEVRLEYAKTAVIAAGHIITERVRTRDLGIEYKPDGSPYTKADKDAESEIRSILHSMLPHDGFVGEEFGHVKGQNSAVWYCDPVDGTWCIINGEKTAATSLALSVDGKAVLGIVYNPFTQELFAGADTVAPTLNDTPIPLFQRTNPKEAVYNFQIAASRKQEVLALYGLWEQKSIAKLISRGGSIAYNLAQVAEGSHSVYIAAANKVSEPWDIAAGVYLVQRAGGVVDQLDGGKVLIASNNPTIHAATLELLAQTGMPAFRKA